MSRLSMNTAMDKNEADFGRSSEHRKSVTAVHVPFIKSRIDEVKNEIEKEKNLKQSLEASIA